MLLSGGEEWLFRRKVRQQDSLPVQLKFQRFYPDAACVPFAGKTTEEITGAAHNSRRCVSAAAAHSRGSVCHFASLGNAREEFDDDGDVRRSCRRLIQPPATAQKNYLPGKATTGVSNAQRHSVQIAAVLDQARTKHTDLLVPVTNAVAGQETWHHSKHYCISGQRKRIAPFFAARSEVFPQDRGYRPQLRAVPRHSPESSPFEAQLPRRRTPLYQGCVDHEADPRTIAANVGCLTKFSNGIAPGPNASTSDEQAARRHLTQASQSHLLPSMVPAGEPSTPLRLSKGRMHAPLPAVEAPENRRLTRMAPPRAQQQNDDHDAFVPARPARRMHRRRSLL